ncbi:hypothetical protein ACW9YV_27790 (plasmid) [Paraburkholderia strydomiana]
MARPRTPTNVLALRGAFDKNPNRAREDAETTGPIGEPPAYFTREEAAAWDEIVANAPVDVLRNSDRFILELASRLLAEQRVNWLDFPAARLARLEAMLGKMGLSPSDRAKVGGGGKKTPKNPFADL